MHDDMNEKYISLYERIWPSIANLRIVLQTLFVAINQNESVMMRVQRDILYACIYLPDWPEFDDRGRFIDSFHFINLSLLEKT